MREGTLTRGSRNDLLAVKARVHVLGSQFDCLLDCPMMLKMLVLNHLLMAKELWVGCFGHVCCIVRECCSKLLFKPGIGSALGIHWMCCAQMKSSVKKAIWIVFLRARSPHRLRAIVLASSQGGLAAVLLLAKP